LAVKKGRKHAATHRYISVETLRLTKKQLEDYIKKTAAAAPGRALATALFDGI
jgi:hypothetical protein